MYKPAVPKSGARTTLNISVLREAQNIDSIGIANLIDHKWFAERTLGITDINCCKHGLCWIWKKTTNA